MLKEGADGVSLDYVSVSWHHGSLISSLLFCLDQWLSFFSIFANKLIIILDSPGAKYQLVPWWSNLCVEPVAGPRSQLLFRLVETGAPASSVSAEIGKSVRVSFSLTLLLTIFSHEISVSGKATPAQGQKVNDFSWTRLVWCLKPTPELGGKKSWFSTM